MLTALAQQRDQPSDVDLKKFEDKFERIAKDEGLSGYRGKKANKSGKSRDYHQGEERDPGYRNRQMPGQSATQTRAGAGRRAGAKREEPKGFKPPRDFDEKLFEDIMIQCYLAGEFVEDHFEASARGAGRGGQRRKYGGNTQDGLDYEAFKHALDALGLRWRASEIESAFGSICEGFNIAPRGKGQAVEI